MEGASVLSELSVDFQAVGSLAPVSGPHRPSLTPRPHKEQLYMRSPWSPATCCVCVCACVCDPAIFPVILSHLLPGVGGSSYIQATVSHLLHGGAQLLGEGSPVSRISSDTACCLPLLSSLLAIVSLTVPLLALSP